jgi:hypothetical protein
MKKRELGRVGVALAAAAGLCGVGLVWTTPPSEAHTCVDVAVYVPTTIHTDPGCSTAHTDPNTHQFCGTLPVKVDGLSLADIHACIMNI